jgi:hypothetical protein
MSAQDSRLQDPSAELLRTGSRDPAFRGNGDGLRRTNAVRSPASATPIDHNAKTVFSTRTTSANHKSLQQASRQARFPLHERENTCSALHGLPRLWTPFWLWKVSLTTFAALNVVFIVVLLVLWFIARNKNGLPVSPSTNHYVWIYGPTAVLVVAVSFWRQVDYHCKALLPWAEMRKGYAVASQTLLLDYLSPFQGVVFWKAFRHGHVVILATTGGFWILKLIVRTQRVILACR